jgi:hypothetical protein
VYLKELQLHNNKGELAIQIVEVNPTFGQSLLNRDDVKIYRLNILYRYDPHNEFRENYEKPCDLPKIHGILKFRFGYDELHIPI